ncbi:MAG TPA: hypothetical protein VFW30_02130 [Bryocella sp.]|nr:hypothetical protein [Bryocella sp.]
MKVVVLLACVVLLASCNAGPKIVIHEEDEPEPVAKAAAPVSNWEYKTDGGESWACARSVDDAAELCFRRSKRHLDSYLHLPFREGNPFFCQRGRCETKLQLDGVQQTVQGTDDSGGGTRILFLPDPQRVLREVEQAKEVRVKPPMFGVDQEFVFHVAGLKWP